MTRFQNSITDVEIREVIETWDHQEPLTRHIDRWMMDHGLTWDPNRSASENHADFNDIVGKVVTALYSRSSK